MPDAIGRTDATAREFAELVCADAAWLRAEFEAIMAAGFGPEPVLPPLPGNGSRPPNPGGVPAGRQTPASVWRTWPPERRDRSPPVRSTNRKSAPSPGR
ncbi:hypothetical protein [Amycolatopsis orientalis]|uniref:hypothetical protein n=1 Tax=Amycolatopsis orientalis TaxID=31958 RepID=UPI0003A1C6B1|nr:hypothetical protein [Amycolatopsis orientalis]